ncbi:Allergen Fus c 3 [Madurella mycetomatis]|uniref:Allergen Fus c 3 n=1 Tax=Madurella mycetomatis TaxID=100816 RepID=A0A175VSY5_9PEZI|nr:Allergen Fus c 3 [Madurella mycetomatis]
MAVQRTTNLAPSPQVEFVQERSRDKARAVRMMYPVATGSALGSSTRGTKKASKKCLGDNNHRTMDEYQENVRQRHNRVGKKYRDKMNGEFGHLLAALHIDSIGDESGHRNDDDDCDDKNVTARVNGRTLNKAKVLDMAREYVGALLEERGALSAERERLRRQLQLHRG